MTDDSPTSQAMHLAMTELKERAERVAELEEELAKERADAGRYRWLAANAGIHSLIATHTDYFIEHRRQDVPETKAGLDAAIDAARSVLNKETNRG